MSKNTDNTSEKIKTTSLLFIIFVSLSIFIMFINMFFIEKWDESISIYVVVAPLILLFISLAFLFKQLKLSYQVDEKIIKQLRDERALEIDFKSQAKAYLGIVFIMTLYSLAAVTQKVLLNNSYLYNISGFYIAIMVVIVGSITYAISSYLMDR